MNARRTEPAGGTPLRWRARRADRRRRGAPTRRQGARRLGVAHEHRGDRGDGQDALGLAERPECGGRWANRSGLGMLSSSRVGRACCGSHMGMAVKGRRRAKWRQRRQQIGAERRRFEGGYGRGIAGRELGDCAVALGLRNLGGHRVACFGPRIDDLVDRRHIVGLRNDNAVEERILFRRVRSPRRGTASLRCDYASFAVAARN